MFKEDRAGGVIDPPFQYKYYCKQELWKKDARLFPPRVGYLNYSHKHTNTHRTFLGLSLLLALLALLSASVLVYLVE